MNKKGIAEKIKQVREESKERKFKQSFDIAINFRNINIEAPEYKINMSLLLPAGRGSDVNVGIFADGDTYLLAKKVTDFVLNKADIDEYAKNRRMMRKFANSCYWFLAQPDMMSIIGKKWGIVLGPRGKMPQVLPPKVDLDAYVKRFSNTVRIRSKKSPTIHVPVGVEDMNPKDVADNIAAISGDIIHKVDKINIASIYLTTTMGKSIDITEEILA